MTKIDLRKYSKIALVGVVFLFLHSLKFFDFIGLNETLHVFIGKLLALALIGLCLFSKGPKHIPGGYWMLALLVVPMLSFIPCWLENGQSPIKSFSVYLPYGFALVYFVLHKARISPSELIRILTVLALIRMAIYIIQQFTYPYYLFAFRQEGLNSFGVFTGIEIRSGIYRYYIEDTYLSMFLAFYYLQRTIKHRRLTDLLLFTAGLAGVYLDQSRQFIAATLIAIVFVLFVGSSIKHKGWIILCLCAVLAVVLFNSQKLFEDLFLMTKDDLSSDNIRLLAYTTYAFELWGGPLSIIFGNGPPGDSAYGEHVRYYCEELRLFYNDIGIVGAANLFGIATVLLFLAFYVFFVFKNWRKLQIHLKMYYIAMLVYLPLVSIYTQSINWFVFFAFMLYLSDRSIIGYNRRMHKLRESRAVKTEEHS